MLLETSVHFRMLSMGERMHNLDYQDMCVTSPSGSCLTIEYNNLIKDFVSNVKFWKLDGKTRKMCGIACYWLN